MVSPSAPADLTLGDLEGLKSRSLRFGMIGDLYVMHIFAGSLNLTRICGRVGFSEDPEVLLVGITTAHGVSSLSSYPHASKISIYRYICGIPRTG